MEKNFNIFIDHAWNKTQNDGLFAQRLKDRIKTIKQSFNITTYGDLNAGDNWEQATAEAIDNADIIITIISGDYLAFIPAIEDRFNKIIESKNKYLFPILYRAADWGTYNWIVKSKLIPEDNIPLTEHSENENDKIINDLVSNIGDIINRYFKATRNEIEAIEIPSSTQDKIVFISHDHEDGDFAELLKLQLEKNGIKGWIDSERLKIGQDWREEIDDSITNSLAVVAIMTPESRKSEYVTYEWAFAWGKGKKIFPLMLKQTPLHPRLESLQYLDFTKRNSRPFDKLIESLKDLAK